MATCSKTSTYTNILDLPRISNISNGDLLIVQSDDLTTTIDFQDVLIPLENTTFAGTISSQSALIETNTTNIATLCSDLAQLAFNVSNITTIDVNNVTPVGSTNGGGSGSTRNSILQAMSSTTPSFPWRTLQTVKKDSQVIAAQPLNGIWTDIVSLCGNITRSTLSSYVRVQCSISNAIYQNGYSAGFRICRGNTPIGVPDDVGGIRVPATGVRTNNIASNLGTGQPFALETTTFEIVDKLENIATSNLTYKVQARSSTGLYINVPNLVNTASYGYNAISTITLTELV
jgi:hypothetical protein